MVESSHQQQVPITFDSLITESEEKEMQAKSQEFTGYQDSIQNIGGGDIRQRQQSCLIKDLPDDEIPDFWKQQQQNQQQRANRMTIKDIVLMDVEDESLARYKQQLLGDLALNMESNGLPPLVEILSVEVLCQDRANGPIKLDLKYVKDSQVFQASEYIVKQRSTVQLRVTFKVHNDIVYGLKYCNVVKKKSLVVEKYEEVMGTFAPIPGKIYTVDLTPEESPGGWMYRGQYRGKSMFVDNDGIVHLQFEYTFNIKKGWE